MTTLASRLRARLLADPAARALGTLGAGAAPSWLTRGELARRLAGRCAALRAEGLGPGDVCLLALPSSPAAAELVLAACLLGAAPLLVAPPVIQGTHSSLFEVLLSTLRRVRPRLAVCDPSLEGEAEEIAAAAGRRTRVLFGDLPGQAAPEAAALPAPAPLDPESVAGLQLTSGTTGAPRICTWSHRGVLASLDAMAAAMALTDDDVCLNWTPLYHDMGLVNNLLLCAVRGVPLALLGPHDFVKRPALWLRGLAAAGATLTWSPNFGFALAASRADDRDLEGVRLDRVRAFYNAAERIHPTTMERFRARFARYGLRETALKANFGCAETVGGATFSAPEEGWRSERLDAQRLERRGTAVAVPEGFPGRTVEVASVGRPAPGIGARVLDRRGRPLPDGRVGELALDTPSAMTGYLGDRPATRRAFVGERGGGLLRTGDLAYLRGDEVFWVGRTRERINVAGRKLDPSDFEPLLFSVPELRTGCMAVFGVDDPDEGTQRVVVVAEVRDPEAVDPAAVAATVRSRAMLELGLHLADVVLVPPGALVKTSSGKRRHRHVRRLYLEGALEPL